LLKEKIADGSEEGARRLKPLADISVYMDAEIKSVKKNKLKEKLRLGDRR
jgi:hypothetical protein